jgi:RNA polymerase sigma-70 factor (ECF subfamily)
MSDEGWLTERFEAQRPRLLGVAYRMLGSVPEAEDAVQESWLRMTRADTSGVENLDGWLTTVVARVALNMLRARGSHREGPLDDEPRLSVVRGPGGADPEEQALLADSVGLALLVVLDTLSPPERLAFVLHDMFGLPFDEIAPLVDRTPTAARQLASRARRRVRGPAKEPAPDLARQRRVVDAYLAATQEGDFEALLRVLDPDVELRADGHALPGGEAMRLRGAQTVAEGALASAARARHTEVALVNGEVGLVMAPRGRLFLALSFTFEGDRIRGIDVISDPERLRDLELALAD